MTFKKLARLGSAMLILAASSTAFAELCAAGQRTEVLWKGQWYKATIVKADPEKCLVTYEGYAKDWDEFVGPERLKIKVLWNGQWYPSRVVKKDGSGYLIHYDGYKDSDNEVVPIDRIQVR